ncbi:TlpA family protein disulfide reductase [Portibacter lacus]|uniref:Thioredoxin domain-containing protein n=1 Tax=Portibacter lacus TaxID=1099794 RepID=A0AA37SRG6_9BACT|nr:TlpA disulfide reductase family protein [Portibacter lacus]GLR18189.1 hypothetical protein GCM10007940_28040 [Portibacter lacus]
MKVITYILFFFFSFNVAAQQTDYAPDFEMKFQDGSTARLSDYKDHVVYISFWASWCGPCIKNFKKYKEIRSQLASEGIVLLNVSIDDSAEKWKEAVKKLDLNGVNTIVPKDSLFQKYPISSIPLYEIIGKDGRFRYLTGEANRDIIGQFKSWVSE